MINQNTVTQRIYARSHWNQTGIVLRPGRSYQFSATGIWWDACKKSDAGGYPKGNFVQEWTRSLRRSPQDQWFALIGTVNQDLSTRFLIGLGRIYEVPENGGGELFCFANDVWGFYWNNFGYVVLTVVAVSKPLSNR